MGGERRPLGAAPLRLDELRPGLELGPTVWREVGQERIDAFAACTDDPQWIHVDPARAAAGPFGTTVAHGHLTLALVVPCFYEAAPVEDASLVVNYGLDRVRFPAPVPSGARVRARFEVLETTPLDHGVHAKLRATIEVEGGAKPACVADAIFRLHRSPVEAR